LNIGILKKYYINSVFGYQEYKVRSGTEFDVLFRDANQGCLMF